MKAACGQSWSSGLDLMSSLWKTWLGDFDSFRAVLVHVRECCSTSVLVSVNIWPAFDSKLQSEDVVS